MLKKTFRSNITLGTQNIHLCLIASNLRCVFYIINMYRFFTSNRGRISSETGKIFCTWLGSASPASTKKKYDFRMFQFTDKDKDSCILCACLCGIYHKEDIWVCVCEECRCLVIACAKDMLVQKIPVKKHFCLLYTFPICLPKVE